jgi:hypothetical protein
VRHGIEQSAQNFWPIFFEGCPEVCFGLALVFANDL